MYYYVYILRGDMMQAHNELLLWCAEEWHKGNRIKASKIKRIADRMKRKHRENFERM